MSRWDEVLAQSDVGTPPSVEDQVLVLPSTVDDAVVQDVVVEWFGADDDRSALRVVVDGVDRGLLRRSDAHALAGGGNRGLLGRDAAPGYGSSDGMDLPGVSTQYVVLQLACPVLDCAVRASCLSYDPDDAPHCPVHGQQLVLASG